MRILAIFLFICALAPVVSAGDDEALNYIHRFSYIAQSEMQRTGIPASIKLAQGLLESGSGQSTLSVKANNHFGIKCHKNWNGGTYYHKDDEYKNGKLTESCFRKYESARESYIAHSEFLIRSRRYAFLFEYEITDYKSWAKGLKKAGYASDKQYPKKLIKLIEKYDLTRFDDANYSKDFLADERSNKPEVTNSNRVTLEEKKEAFVGVEGEHYINVHRVNGVQTVKVVEGETWGELESRMKLDMAKLIEFNDVAGASKNDRIGKAYLYIQNKNKKYQGKLEYHTVTGNETMEDIAHTYGIQLARLLEINRLEENAIPLRGELVSLKSFVQWGKRPKFKMPHATQEEELLFAFDDL